MFIDITGYVTELHGEDGFKIKVTSDKVYSRSSSDLQVSKEVRIFISPDRYPSDNGSEFKLTTVEDKDQRDRINKFRSLSNALRMGDRVNCAVFVVEREIRNEVETYVINYRPKDIKTYADFDYLWLCPYDSCLKRLDVDSRESLKFRKQWRYACINRVKYGKITGYAYKYRSRRWINKNPKMIFPILWWIQVKTTASNLWKRFTKQENLTITLTIVTIISVLSALIIAWLHFFKKP